LKSRGEQVEILFCAPKGMSFREIGRQCGCDPRTAKKYTEHPELIGKKRQSPPRPSLVDAFLEQIEAYLDDQHGNHRATSIYDKLVTAGFTGGYEIVKRAVRDIKGRKQRLAYVRFETIPGEQAQVDFGEFQVTLDDGSIRKYYLFAMILGYSRKLFACLLERCDLPSFLEAHILAFEWLGGVPQDILYDRMRNVYIRKLNDTTDADAVAMGVGRPLFTQSLMTLAMHYRFRPMVAPAYAAWVKGKIERPIDFIRESWWRGYEFTDLVTANRDLEVWLLQKEARVHGTTHERVDVRFEREKSYLQSLPKARCDVSLRLTRQVRKDCTISVEANLYIVPHTLVGQQLTVRLKDRHLRIFDGAQLVEEYDAPEGKGRLVGLDRGHYDALRADRALQQRKFGGGHPQRKGRARFKRTISPTVPPHPVHVEPVTVLDTHKPAMDVERRPIDVYARLGGEVSYA
jgi:transposase